MLAHAKLPKMVNEMVDAVAPAACIQNKLPTSVLKVEAPEMV